MQKQCILALFSLIFFQPKLTAQQPPKDSSFRSYFIGSTAFLLGNFSSSNAPEFAQLNLGYRFNPKNSASLEFKTWKYAWPLGIPYGKDFEASGKGFPGYIREVGVALVYQHFWWKGLYSAVHVFNAAQFFYDENNREIKRGYQMFNTYRLGYHLKFFKNRFFIEPSLAITHRPIKTKMPDDFEVVDNKWPVFFFGEPGFHFGFNF